MAMFADDTKCHRPIKNSQDKETLQSDMSITGDLKWNKQVQEISSKANKMLGFVNRTAYMIGNQSVRKALYLTLVRSQLAYGSQVWAPQTVSNNHRTCSAPCHQVHPISAIPNRYLV
jgi:hypothetical protein